MILRARSRITGRSRARLSFFVRFQICLFFLRASNGRPLHKRKSWRRVSIFCPSANTYCEASINPQDHGAWVSFITLT